ncbi:hypothetical protein BHM03_00028287 [Ensete ventricosum]|nr:hypothetical protein BHM03_00028287 [Ensete ventricosum]
MLDSPMTSQLHGAVTIKHTSDWLTVTGICPQSEEQQGTCVMVSVDEHITGWPHGVPFSPLIPIPSNLCCCNITSSRIACFDMTRRKWRQLRSVAFHLLAETRSCTCLTLRRRCSKRLPKKKKGIAARVHHEKALTFVRHGGASLGVVIPHREVLREGDASVAPITNTPSHLNSPYSLPSFILHSCYFFLRPFDSSNRLKSSTSTPQPLRFVVYGMPANKLQTQTVRKQIRLACMPWWKDGISREFGPPSSPPSSLLRKYTVRAWYRHWYPLPPLRLRGLGLAERG